MELGAAIEAVASDPQWHKALQACAELPLLGTVAVGSPARPLAMAPALRVAGETVVALAASSEACALGPWEQSEMAVAVAYFRRGPCNTKAKGIGKPKKAKAKALLAAGAKAKATVQAVDQRAALAAKAHLEKIRWSATGTTI